MKNPRIILNKSWNNLRTFLKMSLVFSWISLGFLPSLLTTKDQTSIYHKEFTCLAELLYYEARSTGTKGMTAVAHVVQNRVYAKGFPNSYCLVSKQHGQFDFHKVIKHNKKHNKHKLSAPIKALRTADSTSFEQILVVTQATLDRRYKAPLNQSFGASVLWYCTLSSNPPWASKFKEVYRDSHHKFFKK